MTRRSRRRRFGGTKQAHFNHRLLYSPLIQASREAKTASKKLEFAISLARGAARRFPGDAVLEEFEMDADGLQRMVGDLSRAAWSIENVARGLSGR